MSFAEKIGSLMQRPNEDLASKDEIPWWLKYTARGVGAIGGAVALFFGIFNILTSVFSGFECIFAGILISLVAFTVLIAEAPVCCMFVDFVQDLSDRVEKRPYWNRAVYYMISSALSFFMCMGFSMFLSCGLIFVTGLLYGMMALGKKAPIENMRSTASVYSTNTQQFPPAAASNSNLVEGAQQTSFSNPFDSRV